MPAFFGIGAYTSALLAKAGMPFLATLPLAMLVPAIFGVIVGIASLRVRADFLAITTMGVGFLFVGVVGSRTRWAVRWGFPPSPTRACPSWLSCCSRCLCACWRPCCASTSAAAGWARCSTRIAEDEDTTRVLGVDVPRFKLAAFAMGTALAGLAGALYAKNLKFISPDSFGFVESMTVLSMVVIGGIGSVLGVTAAAIVLSLLPSIFTFVGEYKLLVYGGLLFLMMRFSPDGVTGALRRMFAKGAR